MPSTVTSEQTSPGAGPIIVLDTAKGVIEIETYPEEAPKTVAHVLALIKKGFYNGLRFHRAEAGFVIQVGDPQSRDMIEAVVVGHGKQRDADRRRRDYEEAAEWPWRRRHGSQRFGQRRVEPVLHHAARCTDARRKVCRVRQGDQRAGRCRQDPESRRAQEGFGEGMSAGCRILTRPFRSG